MSENIGNVWVFIEQEGGKIASVSLQLISKGRELADRLGVKLEGVLLGDNDDYPLTLTANKTQITEGDELTLTVVRGGPLDEELKVNISCSQPSRMTTLRAITIPAGEATASATVTVRENLTPQSDVTVTYTAQVTDYETSKVVIPLIDGDRPALTLKLSTDVVSEADGYGALMATVTRNGDLSENLNIFIDNSSNGEVYFDSDRYTISAGSRSGVN